MTRWQGRRGSGNIEDRRRSGRSGGRMGAGGLGIGGVVVVLFVGVVFGVDVTPLLQGTGIGMEESRPVEITVADEQAAAFVSVTLADTEEVWTEIFRDELGR